MNFRFKRKLLISALFQIAILIISLITYHKISLLSYINISFYFSAGLLITSLLLYTIHTGFFDVISKSFNHAFTRGKDKRSWDEIPSLSELITVNQQPLLFYGISTGLFMLIALFVYYA
ncbi:MAG: DUF3899 domain-containing protein [Neobacillus sp.]